jgi:hypothetical protein
MRRLLCHFGFMIAPDGGVGKRFASGFDATNIRQLEPCFVPDNGPTRATATFATAGITVSLGQSYCGPNSVNDVPS